MYCFLRIILGCWFLVVAMLVGAREAHSEPSLKQEVFAKCEFSIQKTAHLALAEKSKGIRDRPTCFIDFELPYQLSPELRASVFVFAPEIFYGDRWAYGKGFIQDSGGNWFFQGTDLLLSSKMLKTSFTEEHIGEETLLVGHQLIKGNVAQGGPITVPGIRILRITPQFVVSVELNFQPLHYEKQTKGYKQLREAVSQELVEIVKSVQITPGIPGPTVRSATTP